MTSTDLATTARSRVRTVTLWVGQALLSVFFLVGSAGPKLFGESYAVRIFDQIGAGQWLRYLVGVLELAGAIGLLIPRLAGLAALGITALMVCACGTQLFILHNPLFGLTPVVLGIIAGLIAWARRAEIRAVVRAESYPGVRLGPDARG
jgi:putative oxidoreductase